MKILKTYNQLFENVNKLVSDMNYNEMEIIMEFIAAQQDDLSLLFDTYVSEQVEEGKWTYCDLNGTSIDVYAYYNSNNDEQISEDKYNELVSEQEDMEEEGTDIDEDEHYESYNEEVVETYECEDFLYWLEEDRIQMKIIVDYIRSKKYYKATPELFNKIGMQEQVQEEIIKLYIKDPVENKAVLDFFKEYKMSDKLDKEYGHIFDAEELGLI